MENEKLQKPPDYCAARKHFSRMGWFLEAYTVIGILAALAVTELFPEASSETGTLGFWVINLLPMYCIALPLAWLLVRSLKPQWGPRTKISAGEWLLYVPITFCFMGAGNAVGMTLTLVANACTGTNYSNVAASIATGSIWYQILFIIIVAPIAEELIFRRILIGRLRVYGEKTAIILSAALFGLYHGNLQQACYAFTLGLVFGYVYNKTGDLKTSIGLHMIVNLFSGVFPMFFLNQISEESLKKLTGGSVETILSLLTGSGSEFLALCSYGICILLEGILMVLGIVLFLIRKKYISFQEAPQQLPSGKVFRISFLNAGMIAFALTMVLIGIISFGNA